MKKSTIKPFFFGLAPRIALISWIVSVGILAIFVAVFIPQQKTIFFQNMESKSRSLEVSLHNALAGAAINGDFTSLVRTSRALLEGDPDLEFLVIVKTGDFVIINQREGWRVEKDIDDFWLPEAHHLSEAHHYVSNITVTPALDREVFHHAHPFEYSGVEWGWFHIGLSMKNYNENMHSIYRQTLLLGLVCMILSLFICLSYAYYLAKPIVRLREIVYHISNGDFTVRADSSRRDEIGGLAESVNIMTEGLQRRDNILDSVRYAAQKFLHSSDWKNTIPDVLAEIGQAVDASRIYVFENSINDSGQLCMSRRCEWVAENISSQLNNTRLQNLPYADSGLDEQVVSLLGQNEVIAMTLSEMSNETRAIVKPQGVYSFLFVPIFVGKEWWGHIGFDDCTHERIWLESEQDSVRAIADMLGTTISRQRAQRSLLEAKANLEERVEERTMELRSQIAAKQRALSQLADTQSSLLEMSRTAGMAEVATGVLHNVGNVLNSVNVSSNLIKEQIRQSRIANIGKVAELLTGSGDDLAHFLTEDSRGRQIPVYLGSLAATLEKEHQEITGEVESLHHKIEHIKEIVTMQQTYGRVSGVVETVSPKDLLEDALILNSGALTRHEVDVVREYEDVPPITADKHAILQILLNFINNAKYACTEGDGLKRVTLRVFCPTPDRVAFQVQDTGVGILPENMERIFQHGFTTRKQGHGFGLHSGALAARALGGRLTADSDGPGCGATFTLEIPVHPEEKA